MQKIGFIYFLRGIVNHQFNSNLQFNVQPNNIDKNQMIFPFRSVPFQSDMNESSANFRKHSILVFHFYFSLIHDF